MTATYKRIVEEVRAEIQRKVGEDVKVVIGSSDYVNGPKKTMLVFEKEGSNAKPSYRADDFVKEIEDGEATVTQVANRIIFSYQTEAVKQTNLLDGKDTKEYILGHVVAQVVNAEQNREMLKYIPHRDFLDLAVIYRCIIDDNKENMLSFIVNSAAAKNKDITAEELHEAAIRNTEKNGFKVKNLNDIVMEQMTGVEVDDNELEEAVVFTGKFHGGQYGASAMLFPEQLDKAADANSSDLFIIPSSIHEIITIVADDDALDGWKAQVADTNDRVVSEEDFLSDNVYRYIRAEKRVVIA